MCSVASLCSNNQLHLTTYTLYLLLELFQHVVITLGKKFERNKSEVYFL